MTTEARLFDPRQYGIDNLNSTGRLLPERSRGLQERFIGMMCGLTTCVPDSRFLLAPEMTRKQALTLAEKAIGSDDQLAMQELNNLIESHSNNLHLQLCEIFNEDPNDCGTVHGNTASELFAEVNARLRYNPNPQPNEGYFMGKVLTFKRGGRVVNKALAGGDIREDDSINYVPATNLFAPPRAPRTSKSVPELIDLIFIDTDHAPIGHPGDAYFIEEGTSEEIFDQYSDQLLIRQIEEKLAQNQNIRLILIPIVDALGRIWPWKDIAKIVDIENEKREKSGQPPIFKLLNAVQALGRVETGDLQKPLDYYDAVVSVSYKGLGGAMNTASLLARKNILQKLYSPGKILPWYIEEFDAAYRTPLYCSQKENLEGAITIPEIHSYQLALKDYYTRGTGKSFAERRLFMNQVINRVRTRLISSLNNKFFVMEKHDGFRLSPSIICFGLKNGKDVSQQISTAEMIKQKAYNMAPALVLSGNVGPVLRISIPEYYFAKFGGGEDFLNKMVDFAADTINKIIPND